MAGSQPIVDRHGLRVYVQPFRHDVSAEEASTETVAQREAKRISAQEFNERIAQFLGLVDLRQFNHDYEVIKLISCAPKTVEYLLQAFGWVKKESITYPRRNFQELFLPLTRGRE